MAEAALGCTGTCRPKIELGGLLLRVCPLCNRLKTVSLFQCYHDARAIKGSDWKTYNILTSIVGVNLILPSCGGLHDGGYCWVCAPQNV